MPHPDPALSSASSLASSAASSSVRPSAGAARRQTPLGLGGAPLGNLFEPVTEEAAHALLQAALESGCRHFDTAPHYGHGLSERRIGDALRRPPQDSRQAAGPLVLSSKVGRLLVADATVPREQHGYVDGLPFRQHWDYSAAGVYRSVEDSLQRLGLARLDVAYVHDCDARTHGDRAAAVRHQVLTQTLPALRVLQREGLVGAVGLGVNDVQIALDLLRESELDALLLAGRYTLLDQSALAELLPLCATRGVQVALGGVFNSGLLAGGIGRRGDAVPPRFDYAPAAQAWIERTALLEAACDDHGVPLRAAALQFAAAHPAVALVLVGARSAHEWHDAVAMARQPIPAAFWQALRAQGLLPEAAPVPA
jgi:D-threo-aldose 1-dehydrogenase